MKRYQLQTKLVLALRAVETLRFQKKQALWAESHREEAKNAPNYIEELPLFARPRRHRLGKRGVIPLSQRVEECHRTFTHHVCSIGHHFVQPARSCGCRICPHDARRRSLRAIHRYGPHIAKKKDLKYLVLSERNCAAEDLVEGLALLWWAWENLRRTAWWCKNVRGAIVALEITYNAEEDTFHPHLNVLFDGRFLPFEILNAYWVRATRGRGQGSRISKADAGTVAELLKYVTKLDDGKESYRAKQRDDDKRYISVIEVPSALAHFLDAVYNRRFVRSYGTFFRLPVADDDKDHYLRCPDCNPEQNSAISNLGYISADFVSLDRAGIFRPRFNGLERWLLNQGKKGQWARRVMEIDGGDRFDRERFTSAVIDDLQGRGG